MTSAYVIESPIEDWVEGELRTLDLTIPGNPTITGTPTLATYNQQQDTSATNLSSTNGSASGSVVTTSTIQALKGGEIYTLAITAVVDGRTMVYLCEIGPVSHPWGV